jgi:FKBP-type peptidyl-prolyl cis-trans isomerase
MSMPPASSKPRLLTFPAMTTSSATTLPRTFATAVFAAALLLPALAQAAAQRGAIPAPADVAAAPADAERTASGLASKVIKAGTGTAHPSPAAEVQIHYTGWTPDGKMFDSSVPSGTPVRFGVSAVVPGFSEGVKLMVVGETRRLWIPGALAYDNIDRPGAPKGMLVFDVELLDIVEPAPAPAASPAPTAGGSDR